MIELCLDKKRYPDRVFCCLWENSVVCGVILLAERGMCYNFQSEKRRRVYAIVFVVAISLVGCGK